MRLLGSNGVWALAAGLALAMGGAAWGQAGSSQAGAPQVSQEAVPPVAPVAPFNPADRTMTKMEAEQAKMRNTGRQKQLVEDTQKLLALANELKAEVDKSSKDTMSLEVIKKADEIEKLAHSVKERMKGN
jgi:predicted flavoprotein YhiN